MTPGPIRRPHTGNNTGRVSETVRPPDPCQVRCHGLCQLQGGVMRFILAYAISWPRCSCRCVTVRIHPDWPVNGWPNIVTGAAIDEGVAFCSDCLTNAKDRRSSATTESFGRSRISNVTPVA